MLNRCREILKNAFEDFTNLEYLPLKILYFLLHGGMMTLFPFLTIQARSLGITEGEIGIIYSLLPFVGIFAPAFAGMLADKVGNFKYLLSLMVALSAGASLLFLTVPASRVEEDLPARLPLVLKCSSEGTTLEVMNPFECSYINASSANMQINNCTLSCSPLQPSAPVPSLSPLNSSSNWCALTKDCTHIQSYEEGSPMTTEAFEGEGLNSTFRIVQHDDEEEKELVLDDDSFCPKLENLEKTKKWQYNGDANEQSVDCKLQCEAMVARKSLCTNQKYLRTLSPYATVVTYGAVRLINGFTLASSLPIFEGAVVAVVKESKGDFGFQRLYANLGQVVLTPISGALIDYYSPEGKEDFRPAFYLYAGLKLAAAGIILFISLDFKQPSNTVVRDFRHLIAMPEVAIFIVMTAISGISFGFLDTFLFWLLQDIGADKSLMGMTVTVGASVGIPLLLFATPLIKRFGHVNILSFSLAVFAVRMLGYSFIYNPWLAMPFEALECITISLVGVVSLSYSSQLSTQSTVVSLQGIYAGTFHGVGRGIGSLLGGFLIKATGTRGTFQILAGSCAIASLVYVVLNLTKIRKWKEERNKKKEESNRHDDDDDGGQKQNSQGKKDEEDGKHISLSTTEKNIP